MSCYGTMTALSLPRGPCSCWFWQKERFFILSLTVHPKHADSTAILPFFTQSSISFCSIFKNVSMFVSYLCWLLRLHESVPLRQSCLCCIVLGKHGTKRENNYLVLNVIIPPLLNRNAFGKVFPIKLVWFVVLFWRLNVVYNQNIRQCTHLPGNVGAAGKRVSLSLDAEAEPFLWLFYLRQHFTESTASCFFLLKLRIGTLAWIFLHCIETGS